MFTKKKVSELVGSNAQYSNVVGVEVELEHQDAVRGLDKKVNSVWRLEDDGSLRVNGAEYVMRKPLEVVKAKEAVSALGKHIDAYTKPVNEGRDGVHVHVNVGDLDVRQLTSFITLWHIVEPLVTNWCGDYRRGNLFCLRLKDAEYIVDVFTEALDREDLGYLNTDQLRYAAVNLKAIPQYGSVEFRCMRSDGNWEDINLLIDLLIHLKELARNVDSPVQLVAETSEMGVHGFVPHILGEFDELMPRYDGWEDDVLYAVRRIQYYAYCKEW